VKLISTIPSLSHATWIREISIVASEGFGELPEISDNPQMLNVDDNAFLRIPRSYSGRQGLRILSVQRNHMNGSLLDPLPSNLIIFWADGNNFTGNLPSSFGDHTSLTEISLRDNQLSGTIPPTFFDLVPGTLELLPLERNQLECPRLVFLLLLGERILIDIFFFSSYFALLLR